MLQLAASDSQLTGSGTVSILVNPDGTNQAPVVSITADNTAITLPTNNVTLTGVVTDDGLPGGAISTQWSQVSGPGGATITQLTPGSGELKWALDLDTPANFTAGGTTYPAAQGAAMDRCNSDERTQGHCQPRAAACADGR